MEMRLFYNFISIYRYYLLAADNKIKCLKFLRQLEQNWSGSMSNFSKSKFGKAWLKKIFKYTSMGGKKEKSYEESCTKSKKQKTDQVVKELLNYSPKCREAGARAGSGNPWHNWSHNWRLRSRQISFYILFLEFYDYIP